MNVDDLMWAVRIFGSPPISGDPLNLVRAADNLAGVVNEVTDMVKENPDETEDGPFIQVYYLDERGDTTQGGFTRKTHPYLDTNRYKNLYKNVYYSREKKHIWLRQQY